jgi:transposase
LDRTRIAADDRVLTDRELARVRTAQAPDAQTCSRLRSLPGSGHIRALVRRYELQDIRRFPRGPALVSEGRLVKGATESAGTRDGTSGTQLGPADRQEAFSEAAGRFLRNHPVGQPSRARLTKNPAQGKAWTVLAPQ